MLANSTTRLLIAAAAATVAAVTSAAAQAPAPAPQGETPAAWRAECTGDGKTIECRAFQQIFQRETRQLVAAVIVRAAPDNRSAQMTLQLPLGLNLTEPVLIRIDNGQPERQPIQVCANTGCVVSMTANDRLLAAMRAGRELKVTVQDANKKPIDLVLPLLGFGLAYDKTK
jgi:invasion protein IalB